jgi:retron-type reverse transcriptase
LDGFSSSSYSFRFEADLPAEQYAYRANRSALDAVRHVHKLLNTGHGQIVDADLSGYFDSIPHADLLKSVARRIVDGAMLHLIKMWLEQTKESATDRLNLNHRVTPRLHAFATREQGICYPKSIPPVLLAIGIWTR